MSLSSRLTNLFSGDPAPKYSDPESSQATTSHYGEVEFEETRAKKRLRTVAPAENEEENLENARPPYLHAMLAGGIGGTTGDMLMHSLDTVKTRQQGDPHMPPKYGSMSSTYYTIWRQEGVRRGLYSGVTPAFLGSFPGTVIFFGTYERSKRLMLDHNINETIAYLAGGRLIPIRSLFEREANLLQAFSLILRHLLSMSHPKYSKPAFNCRVATTIRTSTPVTIIAAPFTQRERS